MSSRSTWRPITATQNPTVFIKSVVARSGYELFVTDLCRIWCEKLSRRDIIKRALNDGASIDPTEGEDQYDILLEKLGSALDQDARTEMMLCKGETDGELCLHISAPLPSPLQPLKWVCSLSCMPEQTVAEQLLMPLLLKLSHVKAQMRRLINDIQTKDSVIFKIIDRLETSGQDLSLVFPNVSNLRISKKKSQREQYAAHVKGLAEFDVETWQKQADDSEGVEDVDAASVSGVLGDLQPPKSGQLVQDEIRNKWWKRLPLEPESTQRVPDSMPAKDNDHALLNGNGDHASRIGRLENVASDFQLRQSSTSGRDNNATLDLAHVINTKPRLVGQSSPMQMEDEVNDGEETASEEEEVFEDQPAEHSTMLSHKDERELSLRSSPRAQMNESSASVRDSQPNKLHERSARFSSSSAEIAEESEPVPAQGSSKQNQTSPPRSRLGGIGGKPSVKRSSENTIEDNAPQRTPPPKPKSKLGGIGGRAKRPPALDPATKEDASPAPSRENSGVVDGKPSKTAEIDAQQALPNTTIDVEKVDAKQEDRQTRTAERSDDPAPRETSKERADEKRSALKRQIEAKAKAPAKKKRKF